MFLKIFILNLNFVFYFSIIKKLSTLVPPFRPMPSMRFMNATNRWFCCYIMLFYKDTNNRNVACRAPWRSRIYSTRGGGEAGKYFAYTGSFNKC